MHNVWIVFVPGKYLEATTYVKQLLRSLKLLFYDMIVSSLNLYHNTKNGLKRKKKYIYI
jgi:hypothetical protein